MTDFVNYTIRPALSSDEPFLREMFYQALHVEGQEPYPREVLDRPKIAKYIRDWGRAGDLGFIAVDSNSQPIGAVWCRLLNPEEKASHTLTTKRRSWELRFRPNTEAKASERLSSNGFWNRQKVFIRQSRLVFRQKIGLFSYTRD